MAERALIAEREGMPRRGCWPGPKLVVDGGRIVGDADVVVSQGDPNWWRGMAVRRDGLVEVRR